MLKNNKAKLKRCPENLEVLRGLEKQLITFVKISEDLRDPSPELPLLDDLLCTLHLALENYIAAKATAEELLRQPQTMSVEKWQEHEQAFFGLKNRMYYLEMMVQRLQMHTKQTDCNNNAVDKQ